MRDILFGEYASTDGHGGGTTNWNGDYSSTAMSALVKPPTGTEFVVHRLIATFEDTTGMQAQEYGNLGAALTNGIAIKVYTTAGNAGKIETMDLTDGLPIKTNAHWSRISYDVDIKTWGAGNELLVCRYTFARHGKGIHLNADDEIAIEFNDDLRGLLSHHFLFQGHLI